MKKSIQAIETVLKNHGIECRYNVWPADDQKLSKTYATVQITTTENMHADDCAYEHVFNFELNLFTQKKDIDAEEAVMDALDELGTSYNSTEYYNTANQSYQISYSFNLAE